MQKHILITGGTDGLGKSTAKKLRQAGFMVTILGKDEAKTKAAADALKCAYVVADIADNGQVEAAIASAIGQNGAIDILINNAGLWIQGALEDNDTDKMHQLIEVNVLGVMYATRAALPAMKARKDGRIINIISQGGLYAKGERAVYTASKWAVTGFTKCMQHELKPFNVGVVGFYPGAMDTPLFDKAGNGRDMSKALDPEQAADALVYLCQQPSGVDIPEFGIQSLSY